MFSQRVKYAIQILAEFEKAKRDSLRLNKSFFREHYGMDQAVVNEVLRALHLSHWIDFVGTAFFSVRDLSESTLYDLVMAVDGRIAMETGISEGWPLRNRSQSVNARAVTDRVTANFITELSSIKLSEMFECYQVTDSRTLSHIRRNSQASIMRLSQQGK